MALQNRVTPFGEIVAEPWRGSLMGNRGCLHTGAGREARLGRARWRSRAWIACRLEFRGRRRDPMPEGRWTALFFWDEACALAAGHRPCGECRRADLRRFKAAWAAAGLPGVSAREIDATLHAARTGPPGRAAPGAMPEGTMFVDPEHPGRAVLRVGDRLMTWTPAGYRERPGLAPDRPATALTPAPIRAVLAAGYRPAIRLG